MVKLQLPGVVLNGPDAADALAIAMCHAHYTRSTRVWEKAKEAANG
jgi:crossover junction endodeoxyribonuclease RuvC